MTTSPANVFVLGAGCSVGAGIPLLSDFIDKMSVCATTGRVREKQLAPEQKALLVKANDIRMRFEAYHSRASFNSWNLEDVLSLLNFEVFAGDPQAKSDYETFVQAIATTIELFCSLQIDDLHPFPDEHHPFYHAFWSLLLEHCLGNLPAIVSFNYDLVLERALWQACHQCPTKHFSMPHLITLEYGFPCEFSFQVWPHDYHITNAQGVSDRKPGLKPKLGAFKGDGTKIEFYKLHGSLNWWHPDAKGRTDVHPTQPVTSPLILPPVFNKMGGKGIDAVWSKALGAIRHAKNLIIVGYSLPRTDIYMQYFLKAGVGPNTGLHRIFVFNPVLFRDSPDAEQMKQRYLECFSPQFQERIEFRPKVPTKNGKPLSDLVPGSFEHMVFLLQTNCASILFNL